MNAFRSALAAALVLALTPPADSREAVTATVSACFTPAESCADRIVAAIDGAQKAVRVQAYMFTSQPILAALAAAERRGVDVQIILDKVNDPDQVGHYTGATFVLHAGIPVWIGDRPAIAHNKVIVIDEHLVVGGSYNLTHAAETRNAENVTFIESPEVAGWFLANWTSRQNVARRLESPGE